MYNERNWISLVEEGMDVYDVNGDKVGTVDSFQYGTEGVTETVPEDNTDDSIMEAVAEVFSPGELPEEVRERLLQHGYIRIDKGLLQGFGYVLNNDIRNVGNDGVHLKVDDDGILTPR